MNDIFKLDEKIFYSSKKRCVIKCLDENEFDLDHILSKLEDKRLVETPVNRNLTTDAILFLSYNCNLRCIYCSTDAGNKPDTARISRDTYQTAIDFIVNNARLSRTLMKKSKAANLIISGGGEPTLEWDALVGIMDYCDSIKMKYGKDILNLSILTNSQMSDDKKEIILSRFDNVNLSTDGKSTQDIQRLCANGKGASYENVEKMLQLAEKKNKNVRLRMTITGLGVKHLEEDIAYFFNKYSCVSSICIEPFGYVGRGKFNHVPKLDMMEFVKVFIKLRDKYLGRIYNSTSLLDGMKDYGCHRLAGLSLVVTPHGYISCCDNADPYCQEWEKVKVGKIEDKKIIIHKEYREKNYSSECESCLAFKFCYGGCPMRIHRDSNGSMVDKASSEYCEYIKELVKQELLHRMRVEEARNTNSNGYIVYHIEGVEDIV